VIGTSVRVLNLKTANALGLECRQRCSPARTS
jgi:hypothetical protein